MVLGQRLQISQGRLFFQHFSHFKSFNFSVVCLCNISGFEGEKRESMEYAS